MEYFYATILCLQVLAFVFLTPALYLVRWRWPRRMPLWLIMAIVLVGGWVLVNASIQTYGSYLDVLVRRMPDPDPSDPVVQKFVADGARMLFGLIFGWLYSLIMFALWQPILIPVVLFVRSRDESRSIRQDHNDAGPSHAQPPPNRVNSP